MFLKEAVTACYDIDEVSGTVKTEEFYHEQPRFLKKEVINQNNVTVSFLNQLSKQKKCITSINHENRFSNW